MKIYSEITPLSDDNIFVVQRHANAVFDYPLHLHPEFELNLVMNCSGRRIVGDSVNNFEGTDLVLLGPNLYHKWERTDSVQSDATVITVQFDQELISNPILNKNSLKHIKSLFENSSRGICFKEETIRLVTDQLDQLAQLDGFEATIQFLSILNQLAKSKDFDYIAGHSFNPSLRPSSSQRIHRVYNYIIENYRSQSLSLKNMAELNNMSESAFSHYFKKRTNKSFTQFVIDFRLTQTIKLLQETNYTIREICFQCGFNNVSNFNRIFKKKMKVSPKVYRHEVQNMTDLTNIGFDRSANKSTYI